jgi:Zn-dependent peptidase ImmA (M78 family)
MSLSKEEIIKIECLTMDLLRDAYRDSEIFPPIDLDKIIQHSGLSVKAGHFPDRNIAGAYNRKDGLILIEKNDPSFRQVFTVAHELGHYYLHADKPDEIFFRSDLDNLDDTQKKQEQEANWFAASLLMPKELFIHFWKILKNVNRLDFSINDLASRFEVSSTACYYRLKNLGIISYENS